MDDADQRLARRQRADDLLAERLFLDRRDECAHDGQRDVGVEQREAHFAQRFLDVVVGEPGLAAQFLDDARQPLREVLEHGSNEGWRSGKLSVDGAGCARPPRLASP